MTYRGEPSGSPPCGRCREEPLQDWTLDPASSPAARPCPAQASLAGRAPRCCLFLAFKKLPALERGAPVLRINPAPNQVDRRAAHGPAGSPVPVTLVTARLSTTDSVKKKQPKRKLWH